VTVEEQTFRDHSTQRIRSLGVGLAEYWPQLNGLYDRLLGHFTSTTPSPFLRQSPHE